MTDYRYTLDRDVAPLAIDRRRLCWVMLNPSTADDTKDDNTMRRVIGFTIAHGYTDLTVVNLMAARSPWPREILRMAKEGVDVVGQHNIMHILQAMANSEAVVCAWGDWPRVQEARRSGPVIQFPPIKMMAEQCPPRRVVEHGHGSDIGHVGRPTYCLGTTEHGSPRHPLYRPLDTRLQEF